MFQVAHNMLHVIGARCAARDFHTIVPWPLERTCWGHFTGQRGDCTKSQTAPLNAVIIVIKISSRKISDVQIGMLVANLLGTWHYGVSTGANWPVVGIRYLREIASCNSML